MYKKLFIVPTLLAGLTAGATFVTINAHAEEVQQVPGKSAIQAVSTIHVTQTNGSNIVKWDKVDGADYYKLVNVKTDDVIVYVSADEELQFATNNSSDILGEELKIKAYKYDDVNPIAESSIFIPIVYGYELALDPTVGMNGYKNNQAKIDLYNIYRLREIGAEAKLFINGIEKRHYTSEQLSKDSIYINNVSNYDDIQLAFYKDGKFIGNTNVTSLGANLNIRNNEGTTFTFGTFKEADTYKIYANDKYIDSISSNKNTDQMTYTFDKNKINLLDNVTVEGFKGNQLVARSYYGAQYLDPVQATYEKQEDGTIDMTFTPSSSYTKYEVKHFVPEQGKWITDDAEQENGKYIVRNVLPNNSYSIFGTSEQGEIPVGNIYVSDSNNPSSKTGVYGILGQNISDTNEVTAKIYDAVDSLNSEDLKSYDFRNSKYTLTYIDKDGKEIIIKGVRGTEPVKFTNLKENSATDENQLHLRKKW